MKLIIVFIAFLFLVLLAFTYFSESYYGVINNNNKKKIINSEDVPTVEFPFKNLFDDNGKKLNIILIAAPFREPVHEKLYEDYKKQGLLFCGISSYLDFPNKIDNPYEDKYHVERSHNYVDMVDAWLTCFRIPAYNNTINKVPNMLLTEADLKDVKNTQAPTGKKEYDFLYCCLSDNDQCTPGWQSYNRNWDLAKKCLEVMCSRGLRGILVGRKNCEFTNKCDGIVKVFDFLPYNEFQTEMKKCRFLFIPNISDASPRVITEAICYNIPVLVNENILGGWHNVIPSVTGESFSNEKNIEDALDKLYSPKAAYEPRKWFLENRGKEISGAKLAEFLIKVYPAINNKNMKYATITI